MRRIVLMNIVLFSLLIIGVMTSCSSEDIQPEPNAIKVSGSSFDGIYRLDETVTNTIKYIHETDETQYIKSYDEQDTAMWGLFKKTDGGTYLYYKTEKSGDYPPESGWTCGLGVPKPNFKTEPLYE